jgi:hypothetical protein
MKYCPLLMTFMFAMQITVFANAAEEGRVGCLAGRCNKQTSGGYSQEAIADFVRNLGLDKINKGAAETSKVLANLGLGIADACSRFVKDQEFQRWGDLIGKEFDRGKFKSLYAGTPDILRLCPRFPNMTDDQKDSVFVLRSVLHAYFESTCNPSAKLTSAPNGNATGLFQLHEGSEENYSRGCKDGDSERPENSIRCTLAMLNDLAAKGQPIYQANSHWAVNRPQNRIKPHGFKKNAALTTMKAICSLPSCGANARECDKFIQETESLAIRQAAARKSVAKRSTKRARVAQR